MRFRSYCTVIAGLLLAPVIITAQTATGSITGSVTDASGAVVSGAKVSLIEQETNLSREQLTNTTGVFEFRARPDDLDHRSALRPVGKLESCAGAL